MKLNKIKIIFSKALVYSFIAILIWILYNGILKYDKIIYNFNPIILSICTIIYIILAVFIYKKVIDKIVNIRYIQYIIIFVFFVLSIIIGYNLRVNPTWDMGEVYKIATSYVQTGNYNIDYLLTYPNNIMITLIYVLVFKIASIFSLSNFVVVATVFNGFIITLTVLFTYKIAELLFDKKKALMILLIMLFTTPLYLHVAIYYTDSLSMFFSTLNLFLVLKVEKSKANKSRILFQLLLALSIVIGWKLKLTSVFVIIAVIVFYFLKGIKKQQAKKFLLVIPMIIILLVPYNILVNKNIKNDERYDICNVPLEYWILIGLDGKGIFNDDIFSYMKSFKTVEEKKIAEREQIKIKIEQYDVISFMKHLTEKLKFAWTDGTYFAPEKLKREPINKNILHEIVLPERKYSSIYKYFPQCMHMGLIIFIIISCINIIKKNDFKSKKMILLISMYGLMVFLLIWENRSRYILTMLPIFLLLGVDGIDYLSKLIKKPNNVKEEGNK